MTVTRWSPYSSRAMVQSAMDRCFGEAVRPRRYGEVGRHVLPVDVYETGEELVIKAHIPGAEQDAVSITTEHGQLTIQAHIASGFKEEEAKEYRWHHHGVWSGDVARTVALPTTVDPDKARALFKNGVLTLSIPKSEAAKPRSIPISES